MMLSRKPGLRYVSRGDYSANDFTQDTLTHDGAWHLLDLSALVPANAKVVKLLLYANHATAGSQLRMGPYYATSHYDYTASKVYVSSMAVRQYQEFPIDSTRTVFYWLDNLSGWDVSIDVVGWWV